MGDTSSVLGTIWRYMKLVFGGLLLLPVISIVLPNSEYQDRFYALETDGIATEGSVQKKLTSVSRIATTGLSRLGPAGGFASGFINGMRASDAIDGRSGSGRPLSTTYYNVEYTYTAQNGDTLTGTIEVPKKDYAVLIVGAPVGVLYHPLAPAIHRLPRYSTPYVEPSLEAKLFGLFLFGSLGAFLIWRNWPRPREEANGLSAQPSNGDAILGRLKMQPPVQAFEAARASGPRPSSTPKAFGKRT